MVRTNFDATESQLGLLRQEASTTGLEISELVRRAIDDYLERLRSKRQVQLDDIDTSTKDWFSLEELDAGLKRRGLLASDSQSQGNSFLLSIAGIGSSVEENLSERDEEILATEIDPIYGWSLQ